MAPHEIRIARSDTRRSGTYIVIAAMQALNEAGIGNPGQFEFDIDVTNVAEAIIKVTLDRVAEVLRRELPKKGYRIL